MSARTAGHSSPNPASVAAGPLPQGRPHPEEADRPKTNMTISLRPICVVLVGLALASCEGDVQTNTRAIDQDIVATHGVGGATLDSVRERSAPWSISRSL